jgi:hypothetical protein
VGLRGPALGTRAALELGMQPTDSYERSFGGETWEVTRYRLTAEWQPLTDEKGRKVHGYAIIEQIPERMLGKSLKDGYSNLTIGDKAFRVRIYATRNGADFGAMPSSTAYATLSEAIAHTKKALAQQGKRYAKKYGGAA